MEVDQVGEAEEPDNVHSEQAIVPRGIAASGRFWKTVQESRFSNIKRDKTLHTSWKKKQEARAELKAVKELASYIKAERNAAAEEKRRRRAEAQKRKEENARKAEVVQVIKNPKKLKRLKKKQLRRIEQREIKAK